MTPLVMDRLGSAGVAFAIFALLVGLRYFKKVDWRLLQWTVRSLFTGAIAGGALLFAPTDRGEWNAALVGVALTVAAVSLRGQDSDWCEALLTGCLAGTGAGVAQLAVPVHAHDTEFLRTFVAGSIAGVGAYLGLIVWRRWMWPVWILTALLASIASVLPHLPAFFRFDPRSLTLLWAGLITVVVVGVVVRRWPLVVRELREESTLGFFDARDITSVAHPLRRLLPGVWRDETARRRFVERANELAIRKREQRKMTPDAARLYQLEILKLRMEVQEIAKVRDAMLRESR